MKIIKMLGREGKYLLADGRKVSINDFNNGFIKDKRDEKIIKKIAKKRTKKRTKKKVVTRRPNEYRNTEG